MREKFPSARLTINPRLVFSFSLSSDEALNSNSNISCCHTEDKVHSLVAQYNKKTEDATRNSKKLKIHFVSLPNRKRGSPRMRHKN